MPRRIQEPLACWNGSLYGDIEIEFGGLFERREMRVGEDNRSYKQKIKMEGVFGKEKMFFNFPIPSLVIYFEEHFL